MIEFILNLLVAHAGEIGTALVMFLIGLLKRFLDKGKIKERLLAKGMEAEDIKKIM